jgi:hypothetical protein
VRRVGGQAPGRGIAGDARADHGDAHQGGVPQNRPGPFQAASLLVARKASRARSRAAAWSTIGSG